MKALTVILIATIFSFQVSETTQNKKQNFVPAKIQNGILIPVVNLPAVNIIANPQQEIPGYTLPEVTIVAQKQNTNMLPAVKWNGDYIATSQLSPVDITAKRKKTLLTSIFSFDWLFKK